MAFPITVGSILFLFLLVLMSILASNAEEFCDEVCRLCSDWNENTGQNESLRTLCKTSLNQCRCEPFPADVFIILVIGSFFIIMLLIILFSVIKHYCCDEPEWRANRNGGRASGDESPVQNPDNLNEDFSSINIELADLELSRYLSYSSNINNNRSSFTFFHQSSATRRGRNESQNPTNFNTDEEQSKSQSSSAKSTPPPSYEDVMRESQTTAKDC